MPHDTAGARVDGYSLALLAGGLRRQPFPCCRRRDLRRSARPIHRIGRIGCDLRRNLSEMFSVATADRTFHLWSSRVGQCIQVASQVFDSNLVAHWAGSCLIVSQRPLDPGIKGDKAVRRIRVARVVLN
jgi:hypothetical protein